MADEIQRKRVTLHPVKEDGSIDTSINLYPKTFIDGIVDRQGEQVEVALKEDLSDLATKEEVGEKQDKLTAGDNITIENNVISANVSGGGTRLYKHYISFLWTDNITEEELEDHVTIINANPEPYAYEYNADSDDGDVVIKIANTISCKTSYNNETEMYDLCMDLILTQEYNTEGQYPVWNVFITNGNGDLNWNICAEDFDDRHYYGSHLVDEVTPL